MRKSMHAAYSERVISLPVSTWVHLIQYTYLNSGLEDLYFNSSRFIESIRLHVDNLACITVDTK